MLKIAHISDIHIRNFKYHSEYRAAFEDLYQNLEDLQPDLIVNTGDTAHSKLQISPELVQMVAEHFERASQIAPYLLMLGNHDLNLHNLQRVDAISPIASQFKNVRLLKTCEPYDFSNGRTAATFWPFAMADSENYPTAKTVRERRPDVDDPINIGLFHGSVAGCVTDSDWTMSEAETDLRLFDCMDYVLMGDIHKQQFFRNGTIGYAGSLIQQNFGEYPDKGFLFWKFEDAKRFSVRHVPVRSPLKFRTVRASDDLSIPSAQTNSKNAYVRVLIPRAITAAEQRELIASAKQQLSAKEVICVLSPEAQSQRANPVVRVDDNDISNVRSVDVQENLLRRFLDDRQCDEETVQRVVELNKTLQTAVVEDEDVARNSRWRINKVGWSNLFNYGEGNIIDFSKIPGITGIFGLNGIGKSSIFDVINEGLFDKVTKDVSKNIELINDNREEARVVIEVDLDGREYVIERSISRIKYGQRKKDVKEWGKTEVDFYVVQDGERTALKGQSRPETERAIRRMLGTFEDFCLTTLSPQSSVVGLPGGGDIISCKETDRKKILYKVLDLDVFEKKVAAAKELSKECSARARSVSREELLEEAERYRRKIDMELPKTLAEWQEENRDGHRRLEELITAKERLRAEIDSIGAMPWATQRDPETVRAEIGACERTIENLQRKIDDLGAGPVWELDVPPDVSSKLREAEALLSSLVRTREELKKKESDGKWKLKVLSDVPCGDQFPSCKFLVDAFAARSSLPAWRSEAEQLDGVISSEESNVGSLRERHTLWERYQSHRRATLRHGEEVLKISRSQETARSTREKLLKDLELAETYAAKKNDFVKKQRLTTELEAVTKEEKRVKSEIDTSQSQIVHTMSSIETSKYLLTSVQEQLVAVEKLLADATVYDLYIEAFGKNGVPRMILARALPMINAEINRILSSIVDFSVFLEHDEAEQTIRLYMQYGQYRRRNLALAGGAERFIASLAIRAALISISSLPRTNMFIIDEGFGKLDPAMLDSVQRMLEYLKSCFDHVLLVSHLDGMKDAIDNVIEIGSDADRYAHVEVV